MSSRRPILVLGIGNALLRDEGIGVHVVRALAEQALGPEVEVLDGGTAGVDLLEAIADRRKVIVIDAIRAEGEPGDILRFTPDDLVPETQSAMSVHEFGLLQTLTAARHLGCSPAEVVIFGVKPKEIVWGTELTAELAAAVPRVAALVREELGAM
jgi:hydrogenase maturation protease